VSRRRQKTAWIEGVRVRLTVCASGRVRVVATDPAGDYGREIRVARGVADGHP
jgi:hypothetical protein